MRFSSAITVIFSVSIFLFLLLIFLAGCGEEVTQPPEEAKAIIEGVVKDEEAGKALEGAQVAVKDTELIALTDSEGRYQLTQAPVGKQTISVSKDGYETKAIEVLLAEGERKVMDVVLGEGEDIKAIRAVFALRDEAHRSKDLSTLMSLYSPSFLVHYPDEDYTVEKLKADLTKDFDEKDFLRYETALKNIKVNDREAKIEMESDTIIITLADRFKWTRNLYGKAILEKTPDGAWLIKWIKYRRAVVRTPESVLAGSLSVYVHAMTQDEDVNINTQAVTVTDWRGKSTELIRQL